MAPSPEATSPGLEAPLLCSIVEEQVPYADVDPIASLRGPPPQLRKDTRASLSEVRERYLHHLGQYRLTVGAYVPNLVPLLRWQSNSTGTSLLPSPLDSSRSPFGPSSSLRGTQSSSTRPAMNRTGSGVSIDKEAEKPAECVTRLSSVRNAFRPGTVRISVVNVAAAALGAGALSLPRAMYYAGIVFGPLLMFLLALLSTSSIKIIVQLVEVSHKDSYEEIAKVAFGPWFALLVEVNIILFCFGTAVAYMITVGQISHQILDAVIDEAQGSLLSPNVVLIIVTAVVLLPLSLLDSINDLRFASLAGVACIIYLIGVVVYVFCSNNVHASLMTESGFDGWQPDDGIQGCFKMLSLGIFAFCCQPNVPAIYTELEGKSFRRMDKVSRRSMMLCLFVYLLMGIFGFLSFGEGTQGNILQNLQPLLCNKDLVVTSGFACMAFAVTMAFPLNIFPIRFAVETALFFHSPALNTKAVRLGIGCTTVALSLLLALLIPEINLIFELIGATTGSFVCFIGPGLLFCRLAPGPLFGINKWESIFLVVAGCTFLALGSYSSLQDIAEAMSSPQSTKFQGCRDAVVALAST